MLFLVSVTGLETNDYNKYFELVKYLKDNGHLLDKTEVEMIMTFDK